MRNIAQQVAHQLQLPEQPVAATIALLDAGNTIPFLTRYRRGQLGGLNEEQLREIRDATRRLRQLNVRKQSVARTIRAQGRLTAELETQLLRATTTKQLEDLYLPFKPRKLTRAEAARQRGLLPLATRILNAAQPTAQPGGPSTPAGGPVEGAASAPSVPPDSPRVAHEALEKLAVAYVNPEVGLDSVDAVLEGVVDLISQQLSEHRPLRHALRQLVWQAGSLQSSAWEPPAGGGSVPETRQRREDRRVQGLKGYFDFRAKLPQIMPHQTMALNRGERDRILRVRLDFPAERLVDVARQTLWGDGPVAYFDFLDGCLHEALQRFVVPSLEREARRELTERAERHAVAVFARNLRQMMLQPPVKRRVLAIDPAFRTGCKLAALDQFGNPLECTVIRIVGGAPSPAAPDPAGGSPPPTARETLVELIRQHRLELIAIGNGAACREAEELVGDVLQHELAETDVRFTIVNGAGASAYSTSSFGREELPHLDPVHRSAVSIGRRVLDPLSELVKIPPAHLGVGLYQHDLPPRSLQDTLNQVVESCVNTVGVDVNTASPALLRYVSGLNQLSARRIYEYRRHHGPFRTREQLKDVPQIGDSTFVQAAGFLRVFGGDEPLDETWIHPESYREARHLLAELRAPAPPTPVPHPRSRFANRGTSTGRSGSGRGSSGGSRVGAEFRQRSGTGGGRRDAAGARRSGRGCLGAGAGTSLGRAGGPLGMRSRQAPRPARSAPCRQRSAAAVHPAAAASLRAQAGRPGARPGDSGAGEQCGRLWCVRRHRFAQQRLGAH